ncbi:hypothetical protein BDV06DRAFT_128306 [Aspergillus oleicola]
MWVNLDEIEFYHGPNRQPPSTSAKSLPQEHTPRSFQHSFPTTFTFRPESCGAPLGQEPPLTGMTHQWNIFDQMMEVVEPAMTTDMPDVLYTPLALGGYPLAGSGPAPSKDSATAVSDRLDLISCNMRRNDLPDTMSDTKEAETPRLSCALSVTAPAPVPEQASNASSSPSTCGEFQQEPAKRKLSITGFSYSDCIGPGYYEKDTESRHVSDLGESPCSDRPNTEYYEKDTESRHVSDLGESPCSDRPNTKYCEKDTESCQVSDLGENPSSKTVDAPERAKDAGVAEDKSAASGPSAQPTKNSKPECSGARTTPTSDSPVRYPSIAVVVPPPPWKQRAIRTSTRAAAAVCNKRLRSSQGARKHQDLDASFPDTEQLGPKRKKRRPAKRPLSNPPGPSIPGPCHCSGDVHGVRGSALLTVDSNSGLKPAYYFTFVPDASPMLSQPQTADIPGKQKQYSSDENALLVRLKEKEAMPWSEIAAYFPDRNVSSLQVHYSTKLRHKTNSRSGRR